MANGYYESTDKKVAKGLGKGAAAFSIGFVAQGLAKAYWAASTNAKQLKLGYGATENGFIAYWSPMTSPWNFIGLITGLVLSAVPKKPGSTGREAANLAGYAILGAEGWGFAGAVIDPPPSVNEPSDAALPPLLPSGFRDIYGTYRSTASEPGRTVFDIVSYAATGGHGGGRAGAPAGGTGRTIIAGRPATIVVGRPSGSLF